MTGDVIKHEKLSLDDNVYDIYTSGDTPANYILLHITGKPETDALPSEAAYIAERTGKAFIFAVCTVDDWNSELSPWKARAAFGNEDFGDGGKATLDRVRKLSGALRELYGIGDGVRVIIGGYSLAGLFALWSGYVCNEFDGTAAVSPSVWFDGWTEFASRNRTQAEAVYLSLGVREEKTRNPVLKTVGGCIRRQYDLLCGNGVNCILEWNDGGHFSDIELRTAKGFLWCMDHI
nr:esterase [Clostridia bacterium]